MDSLKARKLESFLVQSEINGYRIIELINNGKSAAVFKASDKDGNLVAIKVFDNELIERFGYEIQEIRIQLEISLKHHSVANLIKILDGGNVMLNGIKYYFIIMEFINGVNLKEYIKNNEPDNYFIQKVVSKIYDATEILIEKGMAHRDIKPENIMIANDGNVILMDLGVLKLIGEASISDVDEKQFVGTLRYAPPEFLRRNEENSQLGWRAINLYQIGGIMHDLIMKNELFYDKEPYTNLVIAIKEELPKIQNDNLNYSTVQLARNLLIKDWKTRLKMVSVDSMKDFISMNFNNDNQLKSISDSIHKMNDVVKIKLSEILSKELDVQEKKEKSLKFNNDATHVIEQVLLNLKNLGHINGYNKSKIFQLPNDLTLMKGTNSIQNIIFMIKSDLSLGFPRPLFLIFRIESDHFGVVKLLLMGAFLMTNNNYDLSNPMNVINLINQELNPNKKLFNVAAILPQFSDCFTEIFEGVLIRDENTIEFITTKVIILIKRGLEKIQHETHFQLNKRELQNSSIYSPSKTFDFKTIIIN